MVARTRIVDGVEFIFSECITCGITYSVPKPLWDYQQMKSGFHHCPNGHSQGWNQQETIEARLRRERDIARQQIARVEDEARDAQARATQEVELRIKSEKTVQRLKKRMAAGTCPCCQRTFQNMSVHMRKQHPTFVADNIVVLNKAAS